MEKGDNGIITEQAKTAGDMVYEKIRMAIISGEFLPGQHLVERDLALKLEVSRTPIREALRKLELENLVTTTAFKGVMVTDYSTIEVKEYFEIRAVLEGLAARLAAERREEENLTVLTNCLERTVEAQQGGNLEDLIYWNDQFHIAISKTTGSKKLHEMISSLRQQINILRMTSLIGRPIPNYEEHEKIFWAIKRGYADVAEALMKHHVNMSRQSIVKQKEKDEGWFQK